MLRIPATVLAVLAVCVVACSSAAPTGTGSAPTPSGPRSPEEQEWDRLVAEAKSEGQVRVTGPQGDENRIALTEPFEKKYGITVDYLGVGGPELPPRVANERGAGLYEWDVFMAGTTTLLRSLKPMGALQPLEPALLLPEVKGPSNWRGDELPWVDGDHTTLALLRRAGQYFYINTTMVSPSELTSWRNLLDPKWKGKIVMGRDPLVAGYGRSMFLFFYLHPDLGPDYIRQLARQDLQMLRDDRTGAQWLAQGRYPICFCSNVEADKLMQDGLPIAVVDPRSMREGTHTTSGPANIALADHPPHPNAAKLYLNWVLSREGESLLATSMGDPSTRADVPTDKANSWAVPDPSWMVTNGEVALENEEPLLALLNEVFAR